MVYLPNFKPIVVLNYSIKFWCKIHHNFILIYNLKVIKYNLFRYNSQQIDHIIHILKKLN
jgi:hypothetical protein